MLIIVPHPRSGRHSDKLFLDGFLFNSINEALLFIEILLVPPEECDRKSFLKLVLFRYDFLVQRTPRSP